MRSRRDRPVIYRQQRGCFMLGGVPILLVGALALSSFWETAWWMGLVSVAATALLCLLIANHRPRWYGVSEQGLTLGYTFGRRVIPWSAVRSVARVPMRPAWQALSSTPRFLVWVHTEDRLVTLDEMVANREGLVAAIQRQLVPESAPPLEPAQVAALLGIVPGATLEVEYVRRFWRTPSGWAVRVISGTALGLFLMFTPFGFLVVLGWLLYAVFGQRPLPVHAVRVSVDGLRLWLEMGQVDVPWRDVVSLEQERLTTVGGVYRLRPRERLHRAIHRVVDARDRGAVLPRMGSLPDGALSRAVSDAGVAVERGLSRPAD